MQSYLLDEFIFVPSESSNKKYDVYNAKTFKKIASFGDKRYQQYHDKIGYYHYLNHNDEIRRTNYYRRFGKNAKIYTAKWFSHNYLW